MKHKHAEILHALADGQEIQFENSIDGEWDDVDASIDMLTELIAVSTDRKFRIKPKETKRVEMWLWFYRPKHSSAIVVTPNFYIDAEAAAKVFTAPNFKILGKVEGSRIEIEVDE